MTNNLLYYCNVMANSIKQLIANRFKDVFEDLKVKKKISSYEALGKPFGIGKQAISAMINGANAVNDDVLEYLVKEFGVNREYVLEGIGEMYTKSKSGPHGSPHVNEMADFQKAIIDLITVTKEQSETTRLQAQAAEINAKARLAEADNVRVMLAALETKSNSTVDVEPEKNQGLFATLEGLMVAMSAVVAAGSNRTQEEVLDDMRIHFYGKIPKSAGEGMPVV